MSPKGWKTYKDFFLRIEPAREGVYRVEAQAPAGGEGKTTFILPFDEKDLEILLLKIGRPRRLGNRGLILQPAQPAIDFGNKLFNAVFKEDVRDIFVNARNEADINDYGLRLRLRLLDVPELADLPWEYLYDDPDFLALSTTTPLVRYIDLPSHPRPLAIGLPLRILVTVSSPHGLPELNIASEQSKIKNALAGLIEGQKLELEFSEDATLQTLQRTLRQARSHGRPYHTWHFIGHGIFDPSIQAGQLALCNASGMLSPTDGFQLGTLFRDYPEIRLVLLNACEGARNSRQDPFAGVAAAIVERGIPAVIGMQFEISDEAAIVFSEGFYSALVDGLPVDAALTEARRSIFFMPNWLEWATPVLFMRSPDGVLFRIQRPSSRDHLETHVAQRDEQTLLAAEKAESEQLAHVKAEEGRLGVEKAEQERLTKEKAKPDQFAQVKGEKERLIAEKAVQEHIAFEKTGSERVNYKGMANGQLGQDSLAQEERKIYKPDVKIPTIRLPRWAIWAGLILVGSVILSSIILGLIKLFQPVPVIPGTTATQTSPDTLPPTETLFENEPSPEITRTSVSTEEPTEESSILPEVSELIAFTSDRDDNWEIYVMNTDGSEEKRVTYSGANDRVPSWSPDGKKIAFETGRHVNEEIFVMNADGSEEDRLTENTEDEFQPAWSPDGKRIAFESFRDGNYEIYVMNPDGSEQTRLTNNSESDNNPAWTPDGMHIAFDSDRDGNKEIYVMNADGSDQIRLTENSTDESQPTWSPDSKRIAFESQRDGNYEIYVMNADGSEQIRLTFTSEEDRNPAWSPGGMLIAFDSQRDGNKEIYVMNVDGSRQTKLTENSADDIQPAWKP